MRILQETSVAGEWKNANKSNSRTNARKRINQQSQDPVEFWKTVFITISGHETFFSVNNIFFLCLRCSDFHSFALNPDFLHDLVMTCSQSWMMHSCFIKDNTFTLPLYYKKMHAFLYWTKIFFCRWRQKLCLTFFFCRRTTGEICHKHLVIV